MPARAFAGSATLRMYGGVRRRFCRCRSGVSGPAGKYERAFDPHGNLSGSYIAALKRA